MRKVEVETLLDHMYWVNHRILEAAARLTPDELTGRDATPRDLRATLVHELDVEWSWRLALQHRPAEEWASEKELKAEDFAELAAIRQRWLADEAEMRAWIAGLSDDDLEATVHPGLSRDSRPMWQFLIHIVMHAAQQQADAATLLTAAAHSPGEIGFLEYLAASAGEAERDRRGGTAATGASS
ncbi:MAG: DinB family protein [Chloroflexota bacterium]|nr:DinB family protein [Chloroflexota bacterium]